MSGLVLKLGPGERVLINSVVIENGDKRARMTVLTPDARVLRLRDALHPDAVNTPVRRVCYIAQLLLAGETDPREGRHQLLRGIEQLAQVFQDEPSRSKLSAATEFAVGNQHYQALKSLRGLLEQEQRLFNLARLQ
jgi:flagellar biosynthesis repressor protein FlbT